MNPEPNYRKLAYEQGLVNPKPVVPKLEFRLIALKDVHEGEVASEEEADALIARFPGTWKKQYRTPAGPWIDAPTGGAR
jgi:hypothetical protein